ncbi:HlyD family secretion protein [Pigmentiphaga sp.]|uniref:efflux RND transporter periplasmic adaptor subunit n=1 Tax=Pigmentiphaga sp. TaxID=1977564 RepID=UPI0025E54AD4|nr:HlyD family secretion protein [Pigmentiphaga sp.]MBX6317026.1 HlyD family secretion protein [Pigmentiphaga sp.]
MALVPRSTARLLRVALTLVLAALALVVLWHIYVYYTYAPQTRDGKIRADVVALAADVSGRVDEVLVHDNERVHKGQVLFTIDRVRLANAVAAAEAALVTAQAQDEAAQREYRRYRSLDGVVAPQERDNRMTAAREAAGRRQQAAAALERARIDLERAQVRAPVNGIVSNFSLRPGAYAMAGQPVMALIDEDSYHVVGYFEETKLSRIRVGSRATILIMGEPRALSGHVESFSAGIEDRERSIAAGTLLANVNPTFSWVRLAQRIPVRIALDEVPAGVHLVAGRTATVVLDEADAERDEAPAQQGAVP